MPRTTQKAKIPAAWPRGMRAEIAAAYVGLSVTVFYREVKAGNLPPSVALTPGRKVWYREDLDARLDEIAGKAAPSPDDDPVMGAIHGIGTDEVRRKNARA